MRIFGGVFIGIVFLTVGIILLLNSIFNFNINIFKLTIGILIVLFGVFILFNGFGFQDSRSIIFREGTIRVSEVQDEYNIIFSSGTVDLSKVKIEGEVKKIKVNSNSPKAELAFINVGTSGLRITFPSANMVLTFIFFTSPSIFTFDRSTVPEENIILYSS